MVIRRHSDRAADKQWLVAAYAGQTGSAEGWLSPRSTLMFISSNAATYERDEAERQCRRMEEQRGWQGYVWVVEPLPKRPIDARTGLPTPSTSADMAAAVDDGMRKELARDKLFRRQANKLNAAMVDMDMRSVVASVAHAVEDDEDDEGGTGIDYDDEEGDDMVLVKKAGKLAKTKKATAGATRPVPKMRLRTAAKSASKRTAAATNGGGPCLCGCPAKARKWLMRGHIKVVNSKLAAIRAGTTTPEREFGKKLAAAYGPWTKLKSGGQRPATTDFDRVRASLA